MQNQYVTKLSEENMNTKSRNSLSLMATIYFLSVIGSVVSAILLYFYLFGPFLILILWYAFYLFKRKKPYFNDWGIMHHLTLIVGVYIFSLSTAFLIMWTIFSNVESQFASMSLSLILLFIILNLVQSIRLMRRSIKSE